MVADQLNEVFNYLKKLINLANKINFNARSNSDDGDDSDCKLATFVPAFSESMMGYSRHLMKHERKYHNMNINNVVKAYDRNEKCKIFSIIEKLVDDVVTLLNKLFKKPSFQEITKQRLQTFTNIIILCLKNSKIIHIEAGNFGPIFECLIKSYKLNSDVKLNDAVNWFVEECIPCDKRFKYDCISNAVEMVFERLQPDETFYGKTMIKEYNRMKSKVKQLTRQ